MGGLDRGLDRVDVGFGRSIMLSFSSLSVNSIGSDRSVISGGRSLCSLVDQF